MRILTSLSFLLLFCPVFGQTTYVKSTKEEDRIMDIILNLPEVRNADNYVRRVSHGKRHLADLVMDRPTKDEPYYHVEVVEDNGMAYHIHFNFYVTPKSHIVKYYDTMTEKFIPEEQCRKKLTADYPVKKR